MSDYHLWFWHASFGYAGSLNDLNVLNLLPFLESLVDGSFKALEEAAGAVPFYVGGENFHALFAFVDGIYPGSRNFTALCRFTVVHFSRLFVTSSTAPVSPLGHDIIIIRLGVCVVLVITCIVHKKFAAGNNM
jgi:hypothetical protein